nr:hypothetical protein [Tanacetum cinerariifolium]
MVVASAVWRGDSGGWKMDSGGNVDGGGGFRWWQWCCEWRRRLVWFRWWGDDGEAVRGRRWCMGSSRSVDEECFWVRQKKPARKVFRRQQRGGRLAAG